MRSEKEILDKIEELQQVLKLSVERSEIVITPKKKAQIYHKLDVLNWVLGQVEEVNLTKKLGIFKTSYSETNEGKIVGYLMKVPVATCGEISTSLDITQTSVRRILRELILSNRVIEIKNHTRGWGRGSKYSLNPVWMGEKSLSNDKKKKEVNK